MSCNVTYEDDTVKIDNAEEFSEQLCIGSDVVRKFQQLPYTMQRYDVFLDSLSEKARKDIAFDTAHKLYGKVVA